MEREEVRSPTSPFSPTWNSPPTPHWSLKLPLLTARPGNVGVQLDTFRTLKMFNRPRCGKFTAQFRGIVYEDSSMESHARVLERTSRRALLAAERLEQMQRHHQQMEQDYEDRRRRREQRARARERKHWLVAQAIKGHELRDLEHRGAITIQRTFRGWIARCLSAGMREQERVDKSARTIQRSLSVVSRRRRRQRQLEAEQLKERQMQAARVLQRQTRKHLRHKSVLASIPPPPTSEGMHAEAVACPPSPAKTAVSVSRERKQPTPPEQHALSPEEVNELVDGSDNGDSIIENQEAEATTASATTATAPIKKNSAAPAKRAVQHQPQRPTAVRRVGGGFRHSPVKSPRAAFALQLGERPKIPMHHTPRQPAPRASSFRSADDAATHDSDNNRADNASASNAAPPQLPVLSPAAQIIAAADAIAQPTGLLAHGADDDDAELLDLVEAHTPGLE